MPLPVIGASPKYQHGWAGKAACAGPMQQPRELIAQLPRADAVLLHALAICTARPCSPKGPPNPHRRSSRGDRSCAWDSQGRSGAIPCSRALVLGEATSHAVITAASRLGW